jgi:nitrite reductase/ring-hydroxylating ferredoxin subunit
VKRARARAAKPKAGPFDGYRRRDVPPPDPELTRVGPGTPCGEYLRRFWQPVAFARELTSAPLRSRILGEDLVVFRDRGGRVGVLHLHCAHRGTSLEFGIPLERGIRCCYHGWVYDVDGRCLETPGEPAGSRLRERIWQGAYPTHEFAGLVFAYLGPSDRRPAFPMYDSYDVAGHQLMPAAKFMLPCNWLQVKDNSMDPVHTAFLHALSSGYQFTPAFGAVPELDWKLTDAGMVYLATRRVGDLVWVRVCDYMPPNIHQFTRETEEANEPKEASRPVIIRWAGAQRRHAHDELRARAGGSGLGTHAGAGRPARFRPVRRSSLRRAPALSRPTSTRSRASARSRSTRSRISRRPTAA